MNSILINLVLRFLVWWLLPKLPTTWKDSEQVRLFAVALLRSDIAVELTKLAGIHLSESTIRKFTLLAEHSAMWTIVWSIFNSKEDDGGESQRRGMIREFIRNRLISRPAGFADTTECAVNVDEFVTTLKAVKILFGGDS